jgi:hypothetical protein
MAQSPCGEIRSEISIQHQRTAMMNVSDETDVCVIPDGIRIDQEPVRNHVEEVVRSTVEETLNGLLEQEADQLCGASRYERSAERVDTRAGHYTRRLLTKAGEVRVQTGADGDRHLFLRNTSQSPPDRERRDGRSGWFGANTG